MWQFLRNEFSVVSYFSTLTVNSVNFSFKQQWLGINCVDDNKEVTIVSFFSHFLLLFKSTVTVSVPREFRNYAKLAVKWTHSENFLLIVGQFMGLFTHSETLNVELKEVIDNQNSKPCCYSTGIYYEGTFPFVAGGAKNWERGKMYNFGDIH